MSRSSIARRGFLPALTIGALAIASVTLSAGTAQASVQAVTKTVSTSSQLVSALASARAGDTITLRDGQYVGKFVAPANGTSSAPITLTGSRGAVLTTGSTGSGYGLSVTGDYWNLNGFSISKAKKGIMLDSSVGSKLTNLDVGSIGQEAIHIRTHSKNVTVANNSVHDTGLLTAGYGEGIYIGSAKSNWSSVTGSSSTPDRSDNAIITGNRISNTTAEGIDIKEGTTGGKITGNVFTRAGYSGEHYGDSWVDVKGNGYLIEGNSGSKTKLDAFQTHSSISGWGQKNTFRNNAPVSSVPGYNVWIHKTGLGNVVACGPTAAAKGLTNIACS